MSRAAADAQREGASPKSAFQAPAELRELAFLRVRRLVGSGIEVAVAATHNHQAPDTLGFWGKALLYTVPYRTGIDPTYLRWVERRLAFAVKRAAEGARPDDGSNGGPASPVLPGGSQ